jgi:hypothetical protein
MILRRKVIKDSKESSLKVTCARGAGHYEIVSKPGARGIGDRYRVRYSRRKQGVAADKKGAPVLLGPFLFAN